MEPFHRDFMGVVLVAGTGDSRVLVEGTIVVIDIDRFEDKTRKEGLNPYRPNIYTATLTRMVEDFAIRARAAIVYGLDYERGTEESIIELPYVDPRELSEILVSMAREMCSLGVSVTIVAIKGIVGPAKPSSRKNAYKGSPYRIRAKKVLERLKRRGGGVVFIDGETVWKCNSGLEKNCE